MKDLHGLPKLFFILMPLLFFSPDIASAQGRVAAQMGLCIIGGEVPGNLPVMKKSPGHYTFDFNTLEKSGLSVDRLPQGSRIINRPLGFYGQGQRTAWLGWAAVLLLGGGILVVSILFLRTRRVNSRLKKSEQLLSFYLQNTPVGAIYWSRELKVIEWNTAAERIFGYTRKEAMGRHMSELILPRKEKKLVPHCFQDLVAGRAGGKWENENVTQAGRLILCDWYNTVLKNESGRTIGVASLVNDITDRKHSEDINKILFAISYAVNITLNLDELYQQIHSLLGAIFDVTNFFIAIVNETEKTLHFPYFVDQTDDASYKVVDFDPEKSLTGLVVSQRQPLLLKSGMLKKISQRDGVRGPVPEIWMGVPIMIKDKVIGVVAVQSYTDPNLYTGQDLRVLASISHQIAISIDRKRAEDELRESEKRYRHLFDHAPAGMFEIDFRIPAFVKVNSLFCEYTGFSELELLSMNPLVLLTQQSRKEFMKIYERVLGGGKAATNVEYEIITQNKEKICVVLNSDYIYENGRMTGARVVVHDITERKRMEHMIIQSEKMMSVGGLAAGMAHEINNPLAGMMQNAQVIYNRLTNKALPANEKTARKLGTSMDIISAFMEKRGVLNQLENINKAGGRAAKIVENMLSFAKQGKSIKKEAKIDTIIEQTLELIQNDYDLKKEYDFKDIEILRDYHPGTPAVFCEKSKIQQVLFNILKNAFQEMNRKLSDVSPKITIGLRPGVNSIVLEIEDNGPGMDARTQKRIFEPFFTTKEVSKGTGLGLSVSYFIVVEDHKGKMEVESFPGKGTRFIIRLPINPMAV